MRHVALSLAAMLLAASCSKSEPATLPGDEQVLAHVNDAVVSAYDVEQSIIRTFGEDRRGALDGAARRRVLEALVTSRAIAQARERELSSIERAALERKVASYREELLVLQYVAAHAPPEPVPFEKIERYYDEHPAQFGAAEHRRYELITSERELSPSERDVMMTTLVDAAKQQDWATWVAALKKEGKPLTHLSGRDDEQVLHTSLRSRLAQLAVGDSSELTFLDGRPYLLRVSAVQKTPPKPLQSVLSEISASLKPGQVKLALETAQKNVMAQARVQYAK
jgi:hypothetical protein